MQRRVNFIAFMVLLSLLSLLSGCSAVNPGSSNETPTLEPPVEAVKQLRIGVIGPSYAQIVSALGLGDNIVALDSNTFDMRLEGLPDSATVMDMMSPDAEVLAALSLDVIIATGMLKFGKDDDPLKALTELGTEVYYYDTAKTIGGIVSNIEDIAEKLDHADEGRQIADYIRSAVSSFEERAAEIGDDEKKTVYFEISPAPYLYTTGTGTFLDEMINLSGGKNIFAGQTDWMSVSAEDVAALVPDIIFTNVNYIDDPINEIKSRQGWENIPAVKNGRIYYIDNNYSSNDNQNIIKAIESMSLFLSEAE